VGTEISTEHLASLFLELQDKGVHNINLVSPTQYADKIREALDLVRGRLNIPVVYNTGGYESAEEIKKMAGYVDVFLTDIKYFSPELSGKYSKAPDYYENAISVDRNGFSLSADALLRL
jgi:putative pyruvate formate lyase activating enzyme